MLLIRLIKNQELKRKIHDFSDHKIYKILVELYSSYNVSLELSKQLANDTLSKISSNGYLIKSEYTGIMNEECELIKFHLAKSGKTKLVPILSNSDIRFIVNIIKQI